MALGEPVLLVGAHPYFSLFLKLTHFLVLDAEDRLFWEAMRSPPGFQRIGSLTSSPGEASCASLLSRPSHLTTAEGAGCLRLLSHPCWLGISPTCTSRAVFLQLLYSI